MSTMREFGYMLPIASPQQATEVFQAEFDAVHKYGGIWVAVWHPFVSGRMSRADAMASLIEHMQRAGGVWFAPLEDIAAHVRKVMAAGAWSPRVDRLPYYERPISGVLAGSGVKPGCARAQETIMATNRSYVAENRDQLARLRRVTDRLSDAQLSHPMPDGWTVSGVLGHLAFWDERIVQLLDRWGADGRGPAPVGFDEAHVDWINDAKKPLCLGLAPREAARIAIASAEAADKRVAELSDALLAANAKAGNPVSVHRAEHRREHLDEIERELKL